MSQIFMGENTVKGARGAKVKVFFQRLHMTCVNYVLVYNFVFCILSLTLHVRYKYFLTKIFILYHIYYALCPLSCKYEQLLLRPHFQYP
jgi:hypothetical protein